MGKYIRKCKAVGDVAVMDVSPVGVRTRARTLALAATAGTGKRIVSASGELRTVRMQEDSENSDDRIAADRCSSNGSSELVKDWLRSADSEVLEIARDFHFTDRRETTPSRSSDLCFESGNMESTARSLETSSCERSTGEKMLSEEEIDAFFSKFEKEEQRRFAEKYNYDVVKDVPLEGRYEWVKLK
ncbi:hypothetical protein AAC387_Pa11g1464 [Persea americana]